MSEPLLRLNEVSIEYVRNSHSRVRALDRINLDIQENDFLCVLGPNGAGKSTLLKLISKEVKPIGGEVRFRGQDFARIRERKWRQFIAQIYQDVSQNVVETFSVEENFLLAWLKRKQRLGPFSYAYSAKNRSAIRDKLRKLVWMEGIDFQQRVETLSGGQRQIVAMTMAYLQGPGIVLLDEPTSSLDPGNESKVIDFLLWWAQKGVTIVMVTHEVGLAFAVRGARLIVLNSGRLLADLDADSARELGVDNFKRTYYVQ